MYRFLFFYASIIATKNEVLNKIKVDVEKKVEVIGSINFVIVFYLVTSSPLYFCIFKCL